MARRIPASASLRARHFSGAIRDLPSHQVETLELLCEHRHELDAPTLLAFISNWTEDMAQGDQGPFVRRLAELIPALDDHCLLEVLEHARRIDPVVWRDELTLPLRDRLPAYKWYRFVDETRGGKIFNALNVGRPPRSLPAPFHPRMFETSSEQHRAEPTAVLFLDVAHNDPEVAKRALRALPLGPLLYLHERFPREICAEALLGALRERLDEAAPWAEDPLPSVPQAIAPIVAERILRCQDREAVALFTALSSAPAASVDLFDLALERFTRTPLERHWHRELGARLATGKAWKEHGARLIARCIERGHALPSLTVACALDRARRSDAHRKVDPTVAVLKAMHAELARALVGLAEALLQAADFDGAERVLSALVSLDPPGFLRGPVHHLREVQADLPERVVEAIDACEEVVRSGGRTPTADGFNEAFLILTGQRP